MCQHLCRGSMSSNPSSAISQLGTLGTPPLSASVSSFVQWGDRTLLHCSEESVTLRMAGCPACSEPQGTLVPLPLLPASLEDRARKSKCRGEEGVTGPEAGGWGQ